MDVALFAVLKNILKVRCEIEGFIETRLCKLRGILRSRVLRVLCDLKILVLIEGSQIGQLRNPVSVQICGYGYVCFHIHKLAGRHIVNGSSMRRGGK